MFRRRICFSPCFRSCIILLRTPSLGDKRGAETRASPSDCSNCKPHASIRKTRANFHPNRQHRTLDASLKTRKTHTKANGIYMHARTPVGMQAETNVTQTCVHTSYLTRQMCSTANAVLRMHHLPSSVLDCAQIPS